MSQVEWKVDSWPSKDDTHENDIPRIKAIQTKVSYVVPVESVAELVARYAIPPRVQIQQERLNFEGIEVENDVLPDGKWTCDSPYAEFTASMKNGLVDGVMVSSRGTACPYKNGQKHGLEIINTGTDYCEKRWKEGVPHGLFCRYRNNRLIWRFVYEDGLPKPFTQSFEVFDDNFEARTFWKENGIGVQHMKDGPQLKVSVVQYSHGYRWNQPLHLAPTGFELVIFPRTCKVAIRRETKNGRLHGLQFDQGVGPVFIRNATVWREGRRLRTEIQPLLMTKNSSSKWDVKQFS